MDKSSITDSKRQSPPIAGFLEDGPVNAPYEWLNGSDTLFIFIHGYLGSPDSFRPLALRFRDLGFDCAAIQLPGHGGDTHGFVRSRAADWIRHVRTEIDRLRPGHRRLILVGHSLGCLLALNDTADRVDAAVSAAFAGASDSAAPASHSAPAGDRRGRPGDGAIGEVAGIQARIGACPVDGLILYASPLRLRFRPFGLGIVLSLYTTPPERDDPVTAAYRLSYGLRDRLYNPFALLPAAQATIDVMSLTRERLSHITAPTLILQSLRDETASPASAREIAHKMGGYVHVRWLRRSRHAWIHPDEQPLVDAEIDRFLDMVLAE